MPAAIGFVSTVIASIATTSALATALYYGAYAAISIGIGIGLNALSSALIGKPKAPRPQDVQIEINDPVAARVRHYGRVKISGARVFAETERGNFHKVLAMAQGRIDAIEEFWIDDIKVTLSGNEVTTAPFNGAVKLETRLGDASQTAYSSLTALFSGWTINHRGNGVASLYVLQRAVSDSRFLQTFPRSADTLYRWLLRGARVKNPVTGVMAWDDNAAAVIMDYLVHPDGMRMPETLINTPLAVAGWQAAYNRCEEAVAIAAGGTEPRYRLWGSYQLSERPADVLRRMLDCCDGKLVPTPDGGLTLDIGEWSEPDVIIDDTMIVDFKIKRGRDVMETANTIRATFLSPENDYQAVDADPFADEDDVEERGEFADDRALDMAPSHSQARRLMKLALYRANPRWVATLQCNLKAMRAFNKRFVRLTYTLGATTINEVMEVKGFKLNIAEGILRSVSVALHSMPAVAYEWDTSQEGTAPVFDQSQPDNEIPLPEGFDVTIVRKTIGGAQVPFAQLSFDASPSAALKIQAEGRRVGDADWLTIAVAEGATTAESFALSDGEDYEFRIRFVTIAFREGDWTTPIEITAIGDPTPPAQITSVVATGGAGVIDYSWVSPNSQNFAATNIYRNTVDDEGTATLVRTEYGPQSNSDSWQETGLSAGTYYAWLTARNTSGVEATPKVATGAITVT